MAHALAYDREGYALFFRYGGPRVSRHIRRQRHRRAYQAAQRLEVLVEYPERAFVLHILGTPRDVLEYGQKIAGAVAMGFVFVYYLHDLRGECYL